MAAIASSRIATGNVFQKPQAKDAGTANGTDPSSTPFQQILSAAADQVAASQAPGRDAGKKSGKDSKPDGTGDPTQQAAKDQSVAAADSATISAITTAQGKSQDTADQTSSGTTPSDAGDASPSDQGSSSAQPQTAPNATQILAAAQVALASQTSAPAANTQDATDSATQITVSSDTTQGGQGTPSDATGDAADASRPSARKPGKGAAKELALSQIQAASDSAPNDAAEIVSSTVPVKGVKTGKPQDPAKDSAKPAASQATTPDPSAMAVAAVMLPAQTSTDPAPVSSEVIAAAAISGAGKGAVKNSAANSDTGTGAANDNRAGGETANPGATAGQSSTPANMAAQNANASASQGANDAQTGGNAQTASSDDKASAPTPDQAPVPAPQSQSQAPQTQAPQTPVAAIQPPTQPQMPANAAASISQNVQVGPQDSSSAANTLGALAVAIAAKSQGGTKQFDIRLDPPDLGRVEVRLSIDTSGKVQASLSADQPRTLDLLKTDAPALTRALRDAGLNVSQNGLNFSLRGQDRQNGSNGSAPRTGRASQIPLIATSAIGSVQGGANYRGPADGRLDIRV